MDRVSPIARNQSPSTDAYAGHLPGAIQDVADNPHDAAPAVPEGRESAGLLAGASRLAGAALLSATLLIIGAVAVVCPTSWPAGLRSQAQTLQAAGTPANSVVLDFTATWCGPCQQMSPIVSKLQRQGYNIRKVDVDQEPNLARQFRVDSMPTFILVIDGKEANRIVGMTTEPQLRRMAEQAVQGSQLARGEQDRLGVPGSRPLPRTNVAPFDADGLPTINLGQPSRVEAEIVANTEAPAAPARNGLLGSIGNSMGLTRTPEAPARSNELRTADLGNGNAGRNDLFRGNNSDDEEAAGPAVLDPVQASVRIRVRDSQGGMSNYGSGTIIDSRTGRTTIVTCGHIFRDLKTRPVIEVDVFQAQAAPKTYQGEVIDFNLEADVGLITIPTSAAVPIARLSAIDSKLGPGEEMFSIGCGGGANPSRENHKVTALNRYNGPENIECTGVPIQGRSGGGLFRADGQLAGVCIAADTKERRGLYAGLEPISVMLEKHQMGSLVRREGRANANSAIARNAAPLENNAAREMSMSDRSANALAAEAVAASGRPATNMGTAMPGADYMNQSPDAEIICIVRPRGGAGDTSRIVVLNRASQTFMTYLLGEVDSQTQRLPVSMRVDEQQQPAVSRPVDHPAETPSAMPPHREPAKEAVGPRPWSAGSTSAFKRNPLPRPEELVPLSAGR